MEKVILGLAALLLAGSVLYMQNEQPDTVPEEVQQQFIQFKQTYNKKYGGFEDTYRLQVFYDNLKFVQDFNAQKGEATFGQTMFFDLTDEEFASTYLTQLNPEDDLDIIEFPVSNANRVDWREKGAVQYVKNQGQCGSCWAFSTTGVVEGFIAATTGQLPDLSEQQLVDCAGWNYMNFGCNGGMPSRALKYIIKNGLATEQEYAYSAVQGKCQFNGGAAKVNKQAAVAASEDGLVGALAKQPVSVAVDATNWKYYDPKTKAVFDDCATGLNHAVLAVAYDLDQGTYTIKNSWTTQWGDQGYIHLKRGNTCGVYNAMVIPQ